MRQITFLAVFLFSCHLAYSQNYPSSNKELPRAVFMSYRSDIAKDTRNKSLSENFIDISSNYQFDSANPDKVMSFPSSNEMILIDGELAYSKTARLTHSKSYKRNFAIPFDFIDRMVYLHIGGAASGIEVYINEEYVGFGTDAKNPMEFDISDYVYQGLNSIELRPLEHSGDNLSESVPGWSFSGINREIYIFSQPKIRARDYTVKTTLDPTCKNGLLETALLVKSQLLNPHTVIVHYDLFDPAGNLVNQASKEIEIGMRGEDTVRFSASITDVKLWNNETPNLYTILYRIKREGRFTEYVAVKTGFRTVEVTYNEIFINGMAIQIKGVNYSEFSPTKGNVLTEDDIRTDITAMKYAGFNTIRTAHPMPAQFYNLCDELGMFVCDVANINTKTVGNNSDIHTGTTNNPAMLEHFLYRVNNTYQRNKSHSSVIMWGLGDNAGNGYNMQEAYLMLKTLDPTRPIMYNSAKLEFNTDIYCADDGDVNNFREINIKLDGQPVVFSRCGFDPAIWTTKGFNGGFIANWTDPLTTLKVADDSNRKDAYKFNTNEPRTDRKDVQSELSAITNLFAGIKMSVVDERKGIYEIENRLYFTNLNEFNISYKILRNGKVKYETTIKADVPPCESRQITLPKNFSGNDQAVITIENIAIYHIRK